MCAWVGGYRAVPACASDLTRTRRPEALAAAGRRAQRELARGARARARAGKRDLSGARVRAGISEFKSRSGRAKQGYKVCTRSRSSWAQPETPGARGQPRGVADAPRPQREAGSSQRTAGLSWALARDAASFRGRGAGTPPTQGLATGNLGASRRRKHSPTNHDEHRNEISGPECVFSLLPTHLCGLRCGTERGLGYDRCKSEAPPTLQIL